MEELKACPFCKKKNFKLYSIGQLETKMLQCQTVKCPLWGIVFRVEAWNTRHEPEVLAEVGYLQWEWDEFIKGDDDEITLHRMGNGKCINCVPVSIHKREE